MLIVSKLENYILRMKKYILIIVLPLLLVSWSQAQESKTLKEKIDTKKEQIQEKKAGLDSLLKSTPFGVSGGLGLKTDVGATVGGKSIKPADVGKFFTETLPDLGLKIKEIKKKEKAQREKKKKIHTEYEGLDIYRIVESTNNGNRSTQVEFHVLKQYQKPSSYAPEAYWYNTKTRTISKSALDEDNALIVHGPYKHYIDGNLMEEGNYYIGTKDGRWESYDANYMLLDKTKWYRGFPMESVISYYDSAHTKIKEVIPIQYGKRKGDYVKYYETGQLMAKGQYDNDIAIGLWTEYYALKRQRKKITRYARYWYDDQTEGVLMSEWDEKGKLTYERPKEKTTEETEN